MAWKHLKWSNSLANHLTWYLWALCAPLSFGATATANVIKIYQYQCVMGLEVLNFIREFEKQNAACLNSPNPPSPARIYHCFNRPSHGTWQRKVFCQRDGSFHDQANVICPAKDCACSGGGQKDTVSSFVNTSMISGLKLEWDGLSF